MSTAQLDVDSCGCRGEAEFPWDVLVKWNWSPGEPVLPPEDLVWPPCPVPAVMEPRGQMQLLPTVTLVRHLEQRTAPAPLSE